MINVTKNGTEWSSTLHPIPDVSLVTTKEPLMTQCTSSPDPSQSIPPTTEWKYDPTYPGDGEWSEEADEIYAARQAVLTERVYDWLCRFSISDGFVRVEVHQGFDEIVRGSMDAETASLVWRAHDFSNYDNETWVLFKAREDVEESIRTLQDDGRIEWVIRNGWPWIFVPNAARDALSAGHTDDRYTRRTLRIHELETMPYREYLLTPEWQARRQLHRQHAGERCQVCNSEQSLHVHHRTYANRGNERFSDLIVLCASCHKHFHETMGVPR
ncbi:MAG: HNH endonuclease signature motif containing protein [Thermomicrobiales bacterium]